MPTYRDTRSGLAVIERPECLRLLAERRVGRLAVVDGDRPMIFPVNYVMVGEEVVFRTDEGTKLTASQRAPVAFEIDHIDEEAETGWSVVVTGRAEEVEDVHTEARRRLSEAGVRPWSGGDKAHWVRIVPTSVTGRHL